MLKLCPTAGRRISRSVRLLRLRRRFRLESVHPGHTVEEVLDETGFEFDRPAADAVPVTPAPDAHTLAEMREVVAPLLAENYPNFAASVFGVVKGRAAS